MISGQEAEPPCDSVSYLCLRDNITSFEGLCDMEPRLAGFTRVINKWMEVIYVSRKDPRKGLPWVRETQKPAETPPRRGWSPARPVQC